MQGRNFRGGSIGPSVEEYEYLGELCHVNTRVSRLTVEDCHLAILLLLRTTQSVSCVSKLVICFAEYSTCHARREVPSACDNVAVIHNNDHPAGYMFLNELPLRKMEGVAVDKTGVKESEHSNQEPATPARPQGALALVGAWREVNEKELEALIEEIYAGRKKDIGRRVDLEV